MKIICCYLRSRAAILLSFICFTAFALFLCVLYGLETEPFVYALEITSFLLLIFLVVDYIRYRGKYVNLKQIMEHETVILDNLPRPADALEEEYQSIIKSLRDALSLTESGQERNAAEQIEYYTMWLHQIKTPISAMRLALQAEEEANPVYEQELFKIERYVEMALQFVKLNNFSGDLVLEKYSLDELLKQSIRKYSTLFIYRKLSLQLDDIEETVTTDSKWLSFIIEQLLSNAIKYTNTGEVHIYTEREGVASTNDGTDIGSNHSSTDGSLALVIEDTGIGIRPEDLSRIFEKGYTGYNGRLDKKASGIGLYMAKKAADRLGLRLHIESKVGQGTKAMLTISSLPSSVLLS